MESPSWRQILGGTAGVALLGTIGYFGQARIHTGATPPATTHSFKSRPSKLVNDPATKESNAPVTFKSSSDFNMPATPKKFKVDISGEIAKPGVYEVAEGQRVEDLIKLAGGFKKDADRVGINLAQKLKDEQKIVIFSIAKPGTPHAARPFVNSIPSTPPDPSTFERSPVKVNRKQPPLAPVSLNNATENELQTVPGIGPSMAKRIIDFRTANGDFSRLEDLRKVKGMGEKLFAKIQEWITL
ncbi:MAG: ComEA family DNA-binding protein [Armatimonadota bacterium]